MLNRFLFRNTSKLPCRLIEVGNKPYLERYYLGQLLGVTFYLHRFVSSDSERHTHNHPWKYGGAVILSGGYTEERFVDMCPGLESGYLSKLRRRRWFNRVDGRTFHRIHDAKPGTWTLFFHGRRQRVFDSKTPAWAAPCKGWGFIERAEYVNPLTHRREWMSVFYNHPPTANPEWWHTAPTGAAAGRVPL